MHLAPYYASFMLMLSADVIHGGVSDLGDVVVSLALRRLCPVHIEPGLSFVY